MAINLDSVFALVKHSVAQMKKQGKSGDVAGHIVLVSSTAGQRGEAFHCDYAATKGALISMVKGLSTELARDGIYVNCVAPGWVDTDMSASALNDPKSRAAIFATIPLGRVAHAGGNRCSNSVSLYARGWIYHRGSFQRQWWRGAGGIETVWSGHSCPPP